MIGKGHPTSKENAKELRKHGAVLFFATDANMLYVLEGDEWLALGHVAPLSEPLWNQTIPKIQGSPYGGTRLLGVPD